MNNNITNEKISVALDIGTTKIVAIAGYLNEHGRLEVLGVGKVESTGVMRGVVANIDKTVTAIKEAIQKVERSTGMEIKEVNIGIAGQHIQSFQHYGSLPRDNAEVEIGEEDIKKLRDSMHKMGLPPGDKILHVIPQEYTVDNEQGIIDPIGMSGNRLEANFHIITGQVSAFNNINRCVDRADLGVLDMTLEPIASAEAVLSQEEMVAGVALVDIGGGTTDLTIFQDGLIRHTAVIPLGGNIITKDIKEGCTVMIDQAEKLKVKFGSALGEEIVNNRIIMIPGLKGRGEKEISEKNLALIIQARVEEILDYVYWEIQRSGYESKLIGGIVLTGGGSLLKNIDKLTSYHTGMDARIGRPVEKLAHGFPKAIQSPIYATAIGLLLKASKSKVISSFARKVKSEITMLQRSDVSEKVEDKQNVVKDEKPEVNTHDAREEEKPKYNYETHKKSSFWTRGLEAMKDFFEVSPDVDSDL